MKRIEGYTMVRITPLGLERVVHSPIEKLIDSNGNHDGWGFVFNERFHTRDTKRQCVEVLKQLEGC